MAEQPREGLTAAELEGYRTNLENKAKKLAAALGSNAESAAPVSLDQPIGRLSRMDAIQHQQMARASQQRLKLVAARVQQALRRIADGNYGSCLVCEEPMAVGRLQSRPEAPRCVDCQQEAENR